jgi:hypothetical protein
MTSKHTFVAGLALGLMGCGGRLGGETGSETHWLGTCTRNTDCDRGSCLCGVCTLECTEDSDCRWPLDTCVAPRDEPGLAQCVDPPRGLCGVSAPAGWADPLSQALVYEREQCTREREVRLVQLPGIEAQTNHVGLAGDEFVVVGPSGDDVVVSRVRVDGTREDAFTLTSDLFDFSTTTALERVADAWAQDGHMIPAHYSSVEPYIVRFRPDGQLALTSPVHIWQGHSATWIAVFEADGQRKWERLFEEATQEFPIALEPLADGGYVLGRELDTDRGILVWDRFDDRGKTLWERRSAGCDARYEGIELVMTSDGMIRWYSLTDWDEEGFVAKGACDLDGNCQQDELVAHGVGSSATIPLPNGMMAYAGPDDVRSQSARVTVIDVDGNVAWQHGYPVGLHQLYSHLMYHEEYDELIVYGSGLGEDEEAGEELFAVALDMFGEVRWRLRRQSPVASFMNLLSWPHRPRPQIEFGPMLQAAGGRLIGLLQPVSKHTANKLQPYLPLDGWNALAYYTIDTPECE